MIQQGIHLARIQGRPLDYRVKVVKDRGRWEFRAMLGGSRAQGFCDEYL